MLALFTALLVCSAAFANVNLFLQAKALQRDGKLDDAVLAYRNFLSQPMEGDAMTEQQMFQYTELLAVAPRTVLMLRHRFRQKIGMATESLLEDFIEEILR